MDNYDLLLRDDWDAESVLIITPYVTKAFFKKLLKTVKPERLYVLVDDGCRDQDIKMLTLLKSAGTKIYIAQGAAVSNKKNGGAVGGLVHAKVFHTIWRNKAATQRRETLLIGSGNATGPAFGSGGNAEIFARVDISKAPDAPDLKSKFTEMREAIEATKRNCKSQNVGAIESLWIGDGIFLRWPEIKVKPNTNIPDSFDAWLQRGWLLSSYVPDADFLKVPVKLSKPLPPSAIEESVNRADWETIKSQVIRYSYLEADLAQTDAVPIDDTKLDVEKWRAKYFVQTHLGYWCSDACYHEKKDEFVKSGKESRCAQLDALSALSDNKLLVKERDRFIQKLNELWMALGLAASDYLRVDVNRTGFAGGSKT
jgi:hypothetical protein